MATGGFKSNATTDFLEEWKAKREKMRAKMLGDIAAATGAPLGAASSNSSSNIRHAAPPPASPPSPGSEPPYASSGSCHPSVSRSSSGSALSQPAPAQNPNQGQTELDCSPMACNDSDKESPSPGKGKEKKSGGPSARKGKGQIEKRKLREKRRSTGVVSIPSNESLDELDDDDVGEKDRREEEELVQANTFQNESMTADPATGYLMETPRSGTSRHKSSEEEARHRHNRQGRDGGAGSLEKRIEDLEKELARERQENGRLQKAHQDKDDLIGRLREEIDLLNRDLDDIEDENEQLKQENKTLLKVVGQLTR
ncbi:PRKC apoptosis WT1 regulator protein [Salarias fasciatus]|uniref:PRKC, apoptosis, WT1, regulator n=1 Tax=Salarias fasciatus TaxID=181472 RepID=A0A672JDR0_SALFA|nr:PRKC apoptosis WT1 regulator protein [Salarias fasciatus]XP_029968890.1 PRKC apoptosis WT1 regulator protein [Salarias fasciatus]